MLINLKNFEYVNFDDFKLQIDDREGSHKTRIVDGYPAEINESFIYGQYEYIGGDSVLFPGELFEKWKTEEYGGGSSSSYSGTVDAAGNVSLSKDTDDSTYDVIHKIYRRDLVSIEDELKRYAEYCFIYISAIYNTIDQALINSNGSGKAVDPYYFELKKVTDKVDWKKAKKDVSYVIGMKKTICAMYEDHYQKSFSFSTYGKEVEYPFVSTVMAPGEEKLLNKKDIRKRKKVHFAYLEEAAVKSQGFNVGKNPHKSAMYIVSIVFLSLWGAAMIYGLATAISSAVKGKQTVSDMIGFVFAYGSVISPFFIIGLVFIIITSIQYKKYKQFKEQYKEFSKH